jgi:hypothetical protein
VFVLVIFFFFCLCGSIPENIDLKEERFVWLMVSEGSVRGWLAPLIWPLVRQNIVVVGEYAEKSCSPHGNQDAERELERERGWRQVIPFNVML